MAIGGLGNSESSTSQKTLTNDQRITADGNAVVLSNRNSGNSKAVVKLGKGATYTVNQGLTPDQVKSIIDAGQAGTVGNDDATADVDVQKAIEDALAKRAADQIENAPAEDKKISFGTWVILAVGGFCLMVAVQSKTKFKLPVPL